MPRHLSDELARGAAEAYERHGNEAAAAKELGLSRGGFHQRIKRASQRGFLLGHAPPPAMPGYRVSQVTTNSKSGAQSIEQKPEHGEEFKIPAGHLVKGVSALVDPEGREIVKWVKTKEGADGPDIVEALKEAFKGYEGRAPPVAAPAAADADLLTLIPCNDWHVNLLCWGRES